MVLMSNCSPLTEIYNITEKVHFKKILKSTIQPREMNLEMCPNITIAIQQTCNPEETMPKNFLKSSVKKWTHFDFSSFKMARVDNYWNNSVLSCIQNKFDE